MLSKQLNDPEGTGIDTKMAYSRFYLDFGKRQRIIHHPPSNFPEMNIDEGFLFPTMYRSFVSKVINPRVSHQHSCYMNHLDHDDFSTKCGHAKDYTASATDLEIKLFEIGETLFILNKDFRVL